MPIWLGSYRGGPAMTEYTIKKIGHQWMVYADRQSIGACADEDSALKLIAEDSAARSAVLGQADKTRRREPGGLLAAVVR
jgi:hypothetical protein